MYVCESGVCVYICVCVCVHLCVCMKTDGQFAATEQAFQ